MTYKQWLRDNYANKEHPFGDLFLDATKDKGFPWNKNYYVQKKYLEASGAIPSCIEAHYNSYLEYEKDIKIKSDFNDIKRQYIDMREIERKKIIDMLKIQGYTKASGEKLDYRGGSGIKDYTSIGEFEKPYDLSNWKWIIAYIEETKFTISLNALEQDKSSGNRHALYDRIAIKCVSGNSESRIITNLELPLNIEELNELNRVMEDMVKKY